MLSAVPKNAPTHGDQVIANIIPNANDERKFNLSSLNNPLLLFIDMLLIFITLILMKWHF